MTDPIFMSASYQPSEYIRAQEAAGKTMPERPGLFGSEGFTFGDFLDIINPLQHIPIVSTIYRAITGDTIKSGSRIAGDTLFGGPIGLVAGVADAMVQESTGKDIGEQAMAMVGVDIGPDHPDQSQPQTGMADASKAAPESQPQPGAGGASTEAQAAQASMQQAAARPAAMQATAANPAGQSSPNQANLNQANLKMSVGRAAGAAPKQKEVAADDAVAESTYDQQMLAQGLAEQQLASRRAIEQMMAGQAQSAQGQSAPTPSAAAQTAAARTRTAAMPQVQQVDENGRVWFPAFPRGAVPQRSVGVQPITQQTVAAKFGAAKAALPPPTVAPTMGANAESGGATAIGNDWAERAAAGYQKYFDMQQQADRTRAADQYH